jgi:cell division protein FtsA
VIAALDVGTTKVVCFIARPDAQGALHIVGIGQEIADGMRAGGVIDMEAAENAIRTAVHRAETMADQHIRSVFVSVSGGTPRSGFADVSVSIHGREIDEDDIQRAFDQVEKNDKGQDRDIVHAVPTNYNLDGSRGIRDPRGMYGDRLGVRLHLVSVAHGSLRNLLTCVSRCDLEIAAPVISSYASGLACLVSDEVDLGVTYIDMGGGTTNLAIFGEGKLAWTETLPLGGGHVTNDIARGLSTPVASAERMKRLYASAMSHSADEREMIEVPELGQQDGFSGRHVPRSLLVGIVRPRLEEILELARDRIESSGLDKWAGRRVVISGGASQIQGLGELAGRVLDKQVRLARPLALPGLAQAVSGPEFATCAGLLLYATQKHAEPRAQRAAVETALPFGNTLGRLGQWLRSNF